MSLRILTALLLTAVLTTAGGCVVAAVGAGAAGGIHLTSQGAEADVPSNIQGTTGRVRAAFRRMGIELTGESSEESGAKREFKGTAEDLDITVSLEVREHGTHIEVSARRNLISWDKEYAQSVIAEIGGE